MKRIITLCLSAMSFAFYAQNLVVNPSFEITNTNCANFGGEGFRQDLNPSWDNANSNIPGDSCSSPDLFSACNIAATTMPDATQFGIGWQYSRTGTRHAGLIAYSAPFGFSDHYREYIQGHTSSPLTAGQTYCVSMYVSLADGCPYAVENIGVYFSNSQYLRNACTQGSLINVTPQLENTCGVLNDTMNWVRLQWNYTAIGGEQYFMIGNFHDDNATNHVSASGNGFGNYFAYYFIDDVSIVANPCCYAEIQGPNNLCINDTPATLTASPGMGNCSINITGTWSGNGVNPSTGIFNPTTAGVGTHTITFTATCGYVTTLNITVSPCQSLNVCKESNGSFTVSNGVPTYSWANWGTTTVQSNDCVACGGTVFPIVGCVGATLPCTLSTTGWANFATGSNVTIPGGANQIQITDGAGTTYTFDPNTIALCNNTPCPTITIASSNVTMVSCNGGNNGAATVSASGGTANYSYTWQPGNLSGTTQSSLTAQAYTITATDANGCTGSTNINITQPNALTATTSSSNASCGIANGSASVSPTGGTSPYTYQWNPSGGTSATASNLASGSYSCIITDNHGCSLTKNVWVNSNGGPTLSIANSTQVSCFGGNNGSATITATGGANPYTISWTNNSSNTLTANNLTAGTYTCTVTDNNNCSIGIDVTITEPSEILANELITAENCGQQNGQISLNPTGGNGPYSFLWTPGGLTTSAISNLPNGTYQVQIIDNAACNKTFNFQVGSIGGFTILLGNISPVSCFNGNDGSASVSVNGATNPVTYIWNPGNLNGTSQTNLSSGSYTVSITDATNCSKDTIVSIGTPTEIQITPSITDANCGKQGAVIINANGGTPGYTYFVDTLNSVNPYLSLGAGNYTIGVIDQLNCTQTTNITINQLDGIESIFIPNIITPNNDHINDAWTISSVCLNKLEVTIFNRWGNLIETYDGLTSDWQGKSHGKLVDPGVYYYKLNIEYASGQSETKHGFITVNY